MEEMGSVGSCRGEKRERRETQGVEAFYEGRGVVGRCGNTLAEERKVRDRGGAYEKELRGFLGFFLQIREMWVVERREERCG